MLRVQAASNISALRAAYRDFADAEIAARLLELPETRHAKQVLTYLPLPDEPSLRVLLERFLDQGVPVFAPRLEAGRQHMSFVRWMAADGFRVSAGGTWVPSSNETCGTAAGVAFVPGRAFDREGFRLGRGGGYYDRVLGTLRTFATLVGVAYECQVIDRVPREPHDQKVDIIVTETRIVRVGREE